ncbi:hypothetical protein I7X12_11325 [Halosimplex litoreum]|jgi:hypothetical protein|uniref:DUF7577 domain-containing protein n=1 Tax=Halosimplex litoreum TaxID=1198301 RepID=A0A7T3FV95_9EURY|nr:hypothetical protein [Halosimplex litoreum]QPV61360.1 hypothetical protein I7X12_11325 [Halosimplex litoreum]
MEPWGWILVYLAGFTLLQLLLVRYFSEDRSLGGVSLESNEASPPQSGERGRSVGEGDARSHEGADEGGDGVRCHQCGTENADEGAYTYCHECLAQLR